MKRHGATADDVAKMTTEERTEWVEKVAEKMADPTPKEATLALEGALWRIRRGGRLVATYGTRLEAQRALKALNETKLAAPGGSDKENRSEAE